MFVSEVKYIVTFNKYYQLIPLDHKLSSTKNMQCLYESPASVLNDNQAKTLPRLISWPRLSLALYSLTPFEDEYWVDEFIIRRNYSAHCLTPIFCI